MKPSDFMPTKPRSGVPVCADCNAPASVVDQPMPQCRRCYQVTHTAATLNLATCKACDYSYSLDTWSRCPNDECPTNARSVYDDLMADDDGIDPEPYFPDDRE